VELLKDAPRHALLWRRVTSEEFKLSASLLDQDLQRFDANPASMFVVMSLLHQPRPWRFVGKLVLREQLSIS
jgi:hypothetical protein